MDGKTALGGWLLMTSTVPSFGDSGDDTASALERLDREDLIKLVKTMLSNGVALTFHGKRDRWEEDPNDPDLGTLVAKEDGSRHTKWIKAMMPRLQITLALGEIDPDVLIEPAPLASARPISDTGHHREVASVGF
jgi:hypothetical protein